MRRTSFAVASLLFSATAVAQATQQSNGSIGSSVLGATGLTNGTKLTVQMLDSVTTLNLGATYNAQVSQAIVGSSTNIPGGSPAVVKVVANTACQLVPNVPMASQWQFVDQDNLATTLVRLQIHENGVPVAQFTGVPVK